MISTKNSLSFMNVCKLINVEITEKEYGETSETETETEIYCAELPVTSNEFFAAKQSGFKAQEILVINSDEFSKQQYVEFQGDRYSIYRFYKRADNYTELYCCKRLENV